MNSAPEIALQKKLQRWARLLVLVILLIAVLVFAGWLFGIPGLRRPLPNLVAMNPLTSLCFIFLSISLLTMTPVNKPSGNSLVGIFFASLVFLVGLLKASDLALGLGWNIDHVLFPDKLKSDIPGAVTNSMAPSAAVCFIICAVSLLFHYIYEARRKIHLSQYLALLVALIGWIRVLGYLYHERTFYGILFYTPMSLYTAFCFFLFAVAMLFIQPMKGPMKQLTGRFSGSLMARILIPATILVPSVLGYIRIERYRAGIHSDELGTATLVLSIIIIYAAITWYNASLLNNRDKQNLESESALRDSEEQIRAIFDNAPDSVVVINSEGRIVKWNAEAEKLFGWKADEVINELLSEKIIPAQFRESHTKGMQRYLDTGKSDFLGRNIELFAVKKDKTEVDVALSISPMIIANKKYFIGFIRDITERKILENKLKSFNEDLARQVADKTQELATSESRFRSIIEQFPYPVVIFNTNGDYLSTNEAWETMWQSKREDVRNYNIRNDPQLAAAGLSVYVEKAFTGEVAISPPYFYDPALVGQKGVKRWMVMTLYPLKNTEGEIMEVVLVLQDVTDRIASEEELKGSEQKYKLLFENNPLPMWMLSLPDYDFLDVNNATLELYRYSKEEFLNLDILDLRPKEEIERFIATSNTNFRGVYHAGIWRHKKKDGTIMYVDITTHDYINNGRPTRLVLANDVTEKHTADERLRDSYDSIRELTEHLQKIREEERSHIAREIHDELGQLLTVLKMDVSWLNKRVDTSSPPIKEKFTDLLLMLDTTVKTIRRIASELRPTLLDDLGLVAAIEWHLEEFEKRSGITKDFINTSTELKINDGVKIGLFRILQESLTNVARHSHAKNVKVSLEQKNGHLLLKIADNGKGFDSAKATKKTLGLLGMKERTQMMGGEYHISSKPGQGTVVEVSVPLLEADQ